jgi:hypothetical protein
MNLEWIRAFCLKLPGVTEQVQWGNHLLFKVGGKMFAVGALAPGGNVLSFAAPEDFAELTERPGTCQRHIWHAPNGWLEKYSASVSPSIGARGFRRSGRGEVPKANG